MAHWFHEHWTWQVLNLTLTQIRPVQSTAFKFCPHLFIFYLFILYFSAPTDSRSSVVKAKPIVLGS